MRLIAKKTDKAHRDIDTYRSLLCSMFTLEEPPSRLTEISETSASGSTSFLIFKTSESASSKSSLLTMTIVTLLSASDRHSELEAKDLSDAEFGMVSSLTLYQ